MRREFSLLLVVSLVILSVPADAEVGTAFERRIERLVGSPTPLGPARALSDQAAWNITLDDATVVWIEARAAGQSPFFLTTDCSGTVVFGPSTHEGRLCTRPGTWRVEVDPAGGVAVDITIRFRGHVGDLDGAASAFQLTDSLADEACVVPGVCLP